MNDQEFAVPERLSKALAGDTGGISFSSACWGLNFPQLDDLRTLPEGAKTVALTKDPKNLDLLRKADRLVAIQTLVTTSAIVQELPHLPALRMAFLIKLELPDGDLRLLGGCRKLEHLSLYIGYKLTNLGFLSELKKLRTLFLSDVPRIDFSTLPPLPSMREFVFHGGFHKGVKLPSLAPLVGLKGLRRLELRNITATDGSLEPLAGLSRLERLFLPASSFAVEEYARLAATLPKARGERVDCLNPVFSEPSTDADGYVHFPCKKCGKSRVILTGKGTRMACLACDADRIAQHTARWNAARRPFP